MPFQSEKQRKYLWANEPEIARDWTDKYGSRVKKDNGGIMNQIPFMTGFKLPDVWNQWQQHKTASNLMKEDPNTRDYHQLAANDFMQRFPNTPDWLGKGLGTGYQLASEFGKGILNPSKMSSFLPRALEEGRLNRAGIEGLTPDQQARYDEFAKQWDPTLKSMYPTDKLASLKNAIGTEFGGSAQAAGMPKTETIDGANYIRMYEAKKEEDALKQRISRQGLRYPQSQDLEAQASGMFKEEDEDGNWFDGIRRWGGPIYNAYKGNALGAIAGAAGGLPGMALGAFFGGRKNSAAYRPATGSAGGYNAAQLNSMNALGGYYSEPARDARRTQSRIDNMMARKAAGKSYSQKNLANLSTQISGDGGNNNNNAGISSSPSNSPGHPSNRARGGRMAQGGLASLWQR